VTDAALTKSSSHAQVRIREPAGERTLADTPTIGGTGADVVVPGIDPGSAVQIERRKGIWTAQPLGRSVIRFDGRPITDVRELTQHDVLVIGDAHVIVTDVSRTLLRLDVCHLVGNATVAPAGSLSALPFEDESGDEALEIKVPHTADVRTFSLRSGGWWHAGSSRRWAILAAASILTIIGIAALLDSVIVDVEPADARIRVPGTLFVIHLGPRLLLFPGKHVVRAEHEGYVPAEAGVALGRSGGADVRLRLRKLPGILNIDTGGIAATLSIDGVESGQAPGRVDVPAGQHTIMLRAPRHVDYIETLDIAGARTRQDLKATLQPSWGTMQVSTIPAGAHVSVDGEDQGVAPTVVDAPSGVRRVRITAPDSKPWESSVVLKAGEALMIGPITLGQPDAHLTLTSQPPGAEVNIGGNLRGRTALTVDLPAGIQHEVTMNLPGYATWSRPVFADSGKTIAVDARLLAVTARLTVQGEPGDAQVLIDGTPRGQTPASFDLPTVEHRIEVRKEGFVSFIGRMTLAKDLDRTLHYHLDAVNRPSEIASTLYTQTGYLMRLVTATSLPQDKELARAGRRPNELATQRMFYVGASEVTNEQFRRFRLDHTSGDRRTFDREEQPVRRIGWNDAVAYCNWLSEHDSLPPAYEKLADSYVLRRPFTIGYRLPSRAEWTYAARYAAGLGLHEMSSEVSEWLNDSPREDVEASRPTVGFRIARNLE
jgi:hypothetical protein